MYSNYNDGTVTHDKKKDRYLVSVSCNFDRWELNGDLSKTIDALQKVNDELINAKIEIELHESYGSHSIDIVINGFRLATDKEIEKYIIKRERDDAAEKARKKKEREQKKVAKEKEAEAALKLAEKAYPDRFK